MAVCLDPALVWVSHFVIVSTLPKESTLVTLFFKLSATEAEVLGWIG